MRPSADVTWQVVVAAARAPAAIAAEVTRALPAPTEWPLAQRWRHAVPRAASLVNELASHAGEATHLNYLWQQFGGANAPVCAPYAWRATLAELVADDRLDAAGALAQKESQLFFCEPTTYTFARDHMVLAPLAADGPSPAESEALSAIAQRPLAVIGARLCQTAFAADSQLWFLLTDRPWQITTVSLSAALGRSVIDVAPEGPDAMLWRRALNEIQIEWHNHPVNETRRAQGRREINALWLHGGGRWQPLPRSKALSLVAAAPVAGRGEANATQATLRGWADAAGVPGERMLNYGQTPSTDADALTLLDDLCEPFAFGHWGAWLARWNDVGARIDDLCRQALTAGFAVELVLCGSASVQKITLRAADRWRFWRAFDLRTLLAEEQQ